MFGDRMVLMEREPGSTTLGDVVRTGSNLITGGFTGAAVQEVGEQYKQFIDPNKEIAEAGAQEGDVVEPVGGGGEAGSTRSGRKPSQSPVRPDHLKKKGPQTNYYQESTIKAGGTPTELEMHAEAKARIELAERRTRLAEMKVQGYAEAEMIDYANIHAMDAEEGRRLHREHFSVAKEKQDRLYKHRSWRQSRFGVLHADGTDRSRRRKPQLSSEDDGRRDRARHRRARDEHQE
jgi:hypothetical protein